MTTGGQQRYDIAIIGGGLVGASLACALAPLGLDVALIEAVPFRAASQPSYDDRTLALSASSCRILQSLGLWPALADSATAIREIHVRELDRPGRVVMDPAELGLDCFGHVVEARAFGAAMTAALPAVNGLDLLCPASVTGLEIRADAAMVSYRDGGEARTLEAALLVGADGANSWLRDALGIEAERHDYGETAVICNVTPEQPHRGRAFECFTPSGPFAVMPHVGGRCGLIWCVATADAPHLLAMPEPEFLARANARFGGHLGALLKMGQRSSYPLRLVRAHEDVRPRAVLLGNAAHAIHPVGAQGFNLGLRDVAVLAEVLADGRARAARSGGVADLGDITLLRRYSAWRAPDQRRTVAWSDGLARAFASPAGLVAAARTAGLLAHAFIPPLRRQLAVRAMGFHGRTPRLALGEPLLAQ
ncbi:MAG: 2-octaprenyl-6-methoxyphenyl hydroxylase [Xanthomonadales bacterium]|nr:2-octaprenyl-6-methoxyphenyl hydroxylase [Xanthomonadales bacterium]